MVSIQDIRETLKGIGTFSEVIDHVGDNEDLFEKGLDSFGSVQLMLALEEKFNIEFPDHLLNRRSFSTVGIIRETVSALTMSAAA